MRKTGMAALALLLALYGCASPKAPQAPTTGLPSGGPPQVGMPSPPTSLPKPGPAGMPTPPSSQPASKPGGEQSDAGGEAGGQKGKAPSTSVGLPSPSIMKGGQKGQKGQKGQEGQQSSREARRQAGEGLKRAGEKVWAPQGRMPSHGTDKAGEQLGQKPGGQQSASGQQQSAGGGGQPEDDPLMPEGDGLSPEDRARIQEAMQKAGQSLQEAGDLLAGAETDAEVQAAAEALGRARLDVLIASQEVADAGGNDALEASLEEAKVAVVHATRTATGPLELPADLPETAGTEAGAAGAGEESELDKELNESIAIYEGRLQGVRREVLGGMPPGKSAGAVPGLPGLDEGGGAGRGDGSAGAGGDGRPETSIQEAPQEGALPETQGAGQGGGAGPQDQGGTEIASAGGSEAEASRIPEGIPSAQGDDIVAQQLREAAIAEEDPALREKLWEEYKKYKEGL